MKRSETRATRIVILCEGDTEEIAVREFLRKQWELKGLKSIGLHPINLKSKIDDIPQKVIGFKKETHVLAVFSLIDLQGMEQSRVKEISKLPSLEDKVEEVKKWLNKQVGAGNLEKDGKRFFFPHLSVHQIEAWILSEGSALNKRLHGTPMIEPMKNAEEINFMNPPKKRLHDMFLRSRKTAYQEKLDGKPLFEMMQFDPVYENCRYFKNFFDDLEMVGKNACL